MNVLLKLSETCIFLRGKYPFLRDAPKSAKNINGEETETKPAEGKEIPLASAPSKQNVIGICNEAQLAKVAVAAAAATAEHGISIPSSRNENDIATLPSAASLMNLDKEDRQKTALSSAVLVAKPPSPTDTGISTDGSGEFQGGRQFDSPLKRCGKAIQDMRLLLHNYEAEYPTFVDDDEEDDEEEEVSGMETIWEEDEEELEEYNIDGS